MEEGMERKMEGGRRNEGRKEEGVERKWEERGGEVQILASSALQTQWPVSG